MKAVSVRELKNNPLAALRVARKNPLIVLNLGLKSSDTL